MRKYINRILACVFLGFVAIVLAFTLYTSLPRLAWGFLKGYKLTLPENATAFDNIKTRVAKLQTEINDNIYLKAPMRSLNANFQKAIGRNILEVGGKAAIRLNYGGYYDLFTDDYSFEKADEIIAFAEWAEAEYGIPTAFIYCHGGLYEDGMADEKYLAMDTSNAFADRFLEKFENAGICAVDSRAVYREAAFTPEIALLKSDVHWAHRMALETAAFAAKAVEEEFSVAMNAEALDYAGFTDEVHEDLFFGEFGTRLGRKLVPADDIHVLYPAYETDITYRAEKDGRETCRAGTFEEAVIERDKLEKNVNGVYSNTAYYIYGDYLARTETTNHLVGNETTVLIFKDSFGTPVAGYMTLAAKNVHAVDLRSTDQSMQEIVSELQPDVVIFAYSQQLMRNFSYEIQN